MVCHATEDREVPQDSEVWLQGETVEAAERPDLLMKHAQSN
jgi:hypothetical protein